MPTKKQAHRGSKLAKYYERQVIITTRNKERKAKKLKRRWEKLRAPERVARLNAERAKRRAAKIAAKKARLTRAIEGIAKANDLAGVDAAIKKAAFAMVSICSAVAAAGARK